MELDRAREVDRQFSQKVAMHDFPMPLSTTTPQLSGLAPKQLIDLFETQCVSRHLDLAARILKAQQHGFYTIGSSGHEGNAAIALAVQNDDLAFLHYRSVAFMVQRAKMAGQVLEKIILDHLLSLVASSLEPISGGRHRVLGGYQLSVPPQTSTIGSHAPKAVGAALSLSLARTVKEAQAFNKLSSQSIILASFGDGSLNHSTVQGALNSAHWIQSHHIPLPLIWVCEDNGLAISVPTPDNWIKENVMSRPYMHYVSCDGLNLSDIYLKSKIAYQYAKKGEVVFLHFKTVRLLGHAGSDIESLYRSEKEIVQTEANDPLLHSARLLIEQRYLSNNEVIACYENIRKIVAKQTQKAVMAPKLSDKHAVMASIIPPQLKNTALPRNTQIKYPSGPCHMAQAINYVLKELMQQYPNLIILGEDVGKKGGVYHITDKLQSLFGSARVMDTLLDEQTVLGTAIGLAHNGFLAIPEIQFLSYLHNAVDQLRGEAATLSFFSNGQFTNPMVIRLPGLAYQKGFGGHFHNENAIAFLREIPGLIVACPSNAREAVQLLRECVRLAYQEQRVIVFLEPIALYMIKDILPFDGLMRMAYPPLEAPRMRYGEIGLEGDEQSPIAILSYANGMYLARQVQEKLKLNNQAVMLIDIRWLNPLPISEMIPVLKNKKHILIVDECRKTGSLSEQLITEFYESKKVSAEIVRLTAEDCFIPLGIAWQNILPSTQHVYEIVKQWLG